MIVRKQQHVNRGRQNHIQNSSVDCQFIFFAKRTCIGIYNMHEITGVSSVLKVKP